MLDSYLQPVFVLDEVAGIRVSCPYGIVQRQLLELYDGDHREIEGALDRSRDREPSVDVRTGILRGRRSGTPHERSRWATARSHGGAR